VSKSTIDIDRDYEDYYSFALGKAMRGFVQYFSYIFLKKRRKLRRRMCL
jgi:hypothetical protein